MSRSIVNTLAQLRTLPVGTLLTDVMDLPVVVVGTQEIAAWCDLGSGTKWNHFDHDEVAHGLWFPMEVTAIPSVTYTIADLPAPS